MSEKKRKSEGERYCKGNESLLQLGRKVLQGEGEKKQHEEREKEGGTGAERGRKEELQQSS